MNYTGILDYIGYMDVSNGGVTLVVSQSFFLREYDTVEFVLLCVNVGIEKMCVEHFAKICPNVSP